MNRMNYIICTRVDGYIIISQCFIAYLDNTGCFMTLSVHQELFTAVNPSWNAVWTCVRFAAVAVAIERLAQNWVTSTLRAWPCFVAPAHRSLILDTRNASVLLLNVSTGFVDAALLRKVTDCISKRSQNLYLRGTSFAKWNIRYYRPPRQNETFGVTGHLDTGFSWFLCA